MKKLTLILFAILFAVTGILAQVPNMFKYQAVLRNADGTIIAEESITVDISILESDLVTSVFNETHNAITTAQGLININIGSVEDLSIINWTADNYFIEITVNGTVMGTSQLLSVPYAILAETAKTSADWTANEDTLYSAIDSTLVIKETNIGIGTTTPLSKFHVFGGALGEMTDDKVELAYFNITNQNNDKLRIFSSRNSDGNVWNSATFKIQRTVDVTDMGYIEFGSYNDDLITFGRNNTEFVRINGNGNLGIGTNPAYALDVVGNVNATGAYLTNGSDFAEYFIDEEDLSAGDIAGINLETHKVRKYQIGDYLVGVVSNDAGYIGNNKFNREIDSNFTLVGLSGQLEFDESQVIIENGIVKTLDGKVIGALLANGKIFIR